MNRGTGRNSGWSLPAGYAVMLAAILLFVPGSSAEAQMMGERGGERPAPGERPSLLFFEPVVLFSADTTHVRIDIPYRIDQSFFVAVRNTDTTLHSPFKRRGEIAVELFDSTDVSAARTLERMQHGADQEEIPAGTRLWHEGIFSLTVRPGRYTVVFEATDLESRRSFIDRNRKIQALRSPGLNVSSPIFLAGGSDSSRTLTIANYGADILYGAPTSMLLQVNTTSSADSLAMVRYAISTFAPGAPEPNRQLLQDSMTVPLLRMQRLEPNTGNEDIKYSLVPGTPSDPPFVIVPLPSAALPLRSFMLTVTVRENSASKELRHPFRTIWPEMPASMRDVDYALDLLRYLTTENQLDSLKSGNFEERRDHLEGFWKPYDKTPGTAYNEVMTEYYRRADYAARTFGTVRIVDGTKTDRGRVYILYGPPTTTERNLDPQTGFTEVWYYEHLNRRFTFLDRTRDGSYQLVQPEKR